MNTAEIMLPDDERPGTGLVPAEITNAITSGADPALISKLMDLHERLDANRARKAFDAAMAAAKLQIPVIEKSHLVDFTNRQGQRTRYHYEDLADIAGTVDPILGELGLSYRYRTESTPTLVTVTCIVFHRDGHSEQNTLSASHDASGNKNSIQAIGSTVTYLQRYTLKAALGLAADHDDDGQDADAPVDRPPPQPKPPGETAEQYCKRWERLLEQATEPAAVGWQWNNEHDARRAIFRSDRDRDAVRILADNVTARCRALTEARAAELAKDEPEQDAPA